MPKKEWHTVMKMQKIAVVFPGQGSNFVGMYKGLYDEYEIVRETIDEAEKITGIKIKELCFKGPYSTLLKPQNSHVAILAFSVAAFRAFISTTVVIPQFCVGHSLGEYAALTCAGAIKFSDALKLVQMRSLISQDIRKSTKGGMTIIDGANIEAIQKICSEQQSRGKKVYISCYNSPTQVSISGVNSDLMETEEFIRKQECTVSPLLNSAPFHCPLMEEGSNQLKELIDNIEFSPCRYSVLSNYSGKEYKLDRDFKENLTNHLTNPVKWTNIIKYFKDHQIDLVIDFSAKNMFSTMIGDSMKTKCFAVKEEKKEILSLLKNKSFDNTFISKCICVASSTPNFNDDNLEYEKLVVNNYKKMCEINEDIQSGKIICSNEINKQVLDLLKEILDTKKISKPEQNIWISEILDETGMSYKL